MAMRIKKHYPLDTPVPPQIPQHLLAQIRWYASVLFGTEADQYDSFRSDVRYGSWLASLADRVRTRVRTAISRLEDGDPTATITGYHGLTYPEIEQELRTTLSEIRDQYERGTAPSQRNTPANIVMQPLAERREIPTPESLAEQIKRLKAECDITAEEMAEALGVVPRSIFKHIAGTTAPRRGHLAAYEKLFSDRLGRSVTLKKVTKRS